MALTSSCFKHLSSGPIAGAEQLTHYLGLISLWTCRIGHILAGADGYAVLLAVLLIVGGLRSSLENDGVVLGALDRGFKLGLAAVGVGPCPE